MSPIAGLTGNQGRVLAALLRIEEAISGRAIARITGLSQSTANRTLIALRDSGLVVAEEAPPSLLYRANRDHLAMPALIALLGLDESLRARTASLIATWRTPPVCALIYGSLARGEAEASSDLDALVVRPDTTQADDAVWQEQVAHLVHQLQRWTGRRASVIDLSHAEARRGLETREPFLLEAARDGWLIGGVPVEALVGSP